MKNKIESQRIDVRIPVTLLRDIEKFQVRQGIANRTTAMLELVRIGLRKEGIKPPSSHD